MNNFRLAVFAGLLLLAVRAEAQPTLLHEFAGGPGDGSYPRDSLVFDGTFLYGMTYSGGVSGSGTIFKIGTDGSGYALLHEFAGGSADGAQPQGSLCLSGTTLYGMTLLGGGGTSNGTIFKIETSGTGFTILHKFAGYPSATRPEGTLLVSGSTLYGTTAAGGSSNMGSLFKISTSGTGFTLLHSFTGGSGDGNSPTDCLTLNGTTLYGMTRYGGGSNKGTIFKIETDGSGYALLREFAGGGTDGSTPYGGLLYYNSYLYGMTRLGGDADLGTIFHIYKNGGDFNLMHEFAGGANDGRFPEGSLTLLGGGLYGMTTEGRLDTPAIFADPRIRRGGRRRGQALRFPGAHRIHRFRHELLRRRRQCGSDFLLGDSHHPHPPRRFAQRWGELAVRNPAEYSMEHLRQSSPTRPTTAATCGPSPTRPQP